MPDLLNMNSQKKIKQLFYNSNRDGYTLGQACRVCGKRVTHQQSISPCQCFRYCHKPCLIQYFNQMNSESQKLDVMCEICEKPLAISYNIDLSLKCNIKLINIAGLLLSICSIILLINLIMRIPTRQTGQLAIIIVLLCTSFSIFFLFFINTIAIKHFKIASIASTNLSMIVSAFMDL